MALFSVQVCLFGSIIPGSFWLGGGQHCLRDLNAVAKVLICAQHVTIPHYYTGVFTNKPLGLHYTTRVHSE